ncbi:uncharacterized protein GIQ15_01419 [Arthroderma uncinatum]|uniref:uncharacterized protein n=1 Tax=Arthroderma uncinatum TaxID=74035 RepID=UPI00144A872F|nr:uncharacterized protein GIQ15_01419 [Arthroderma uncinatum]KAF3491902.1 hypothetical protein GIQ15_01419 [Arthroderma uncinatum]
MRESCKQLLTETMEKSVIRTDGAPLDPGVPSQVVIPAWLGLGSDELTLTNCQIAIVDFGEAYDPLVTKRTSTHTPIILAPPEARFLDSENGEYLSFSSDIWSLACVIWQLFGDGPLFQTFAGTWEELTIEHVEVFGKLPDRWWNKWSTRSDWFDDDGTKNVKKEKYRPWHGFYETWEKRFPKYIRQARDRPTLNVGLWSAEEQEAFGEMMKMMLVFEPSKRATIEEILQCDWMQQWGFPEFQRMQDAMRADSTPLE